MAGTIYSLALSQRFDNQGQLLINAPLYLYQANTLTPVNSYRNFGLSVLNPWPLRTDSAGMVPEFWLPDGAYRARLTDEDGAVVYFDITNVQALGPSSGGGGGGGGSVDQTAIFATGDILWKPVASVRAGWVRANGRTVGSATSGATERANADVQPLFEYLWNNFGDDICPVVEGRGVSAAADFAANKRLTLLDMRGRGPLGLDDMGNAAAGILTDGTPTEAGSSGGAEKKAIARANLPNVKLSFSGTTGSAGSHSHAVRLGRSTRATGSSGAKELMDSSSDEKDFPTSSAPNHTHSYSGSTESMNGGVTQQTFNVMHPYRVGTWFLKL